MASMTQVVGTRSRELSKILEQRIDEWKQSVGIVIGIIDPAGRTLIPWGHSRHGGVADVSGSTVFEIGSASKVFTALLFADMAVRREVSPGDFVNRYLPPGVAIRDYDSRPMTLQHLANHTSGLPPMPSNFILGPDGNRGYSLDDLYRYISDYRPAVEPGSRFEYSNLGMALLGHLLSRRLGVDWESLLNTRITGPLGMQNTWVTPPPGVAPNLAQGHNSSLECVPGYYVPVFGAASAIKSTAGDLLTLLAVHLGLAESPLSPAAESMLETRWPTGVAGTEVALAWHISRGSGGQEVAWHTGSTGGFRAFIGFHRLRQLGVVVLSNAFTNAGVDDIGMHVLDPKSCITAMALVREPSDVASRLLERYQGRYVATNGVTVSVALESGCLFLETPDQPRTGLCPLNVREYVMKDQDTRITFMVEESGEAVGLVCKQGSEAHVLRRIGDLWPARVPIPVKKTRPFMNTLSYIIVSTPRSGTRYMSRVFEAMGLSCPHEQHYTPEWHLPAVEDGHVAGEASWLAVPFLRDLPAETVIFHQLRDPLKAINSMLFTRHFSFAEFPHGRYIRFILKHAPECASDGIEEVESAIRFWQVWHRNIVVAGRNLRYIRYRVEDLSADLLADLLGELGIRIDLHVIRAALDRIPKDTNTRGEAPERVKPKDLSAADRQCFQAYGYHY